MTISAVLAFITQPAPTGGIDLWGLILRASLVGKIVLLVLFALSVWTWAVILTRWLQWRRVDRADQAFVRIYHRIEDPDHVDRQARQIDDSGLAVVYRQLYQQHRVLRASRGLTDTGWRESLLSTLERAKNEATETLETQLGILATAAGTSPFIGLFGTVLGVIVAFESIGRYRTADLSVVAPGIAEALVATAMGLFVAIPALVAYNVFVGKLRRYRVEMHDFGTYLMDQWSVDRGAAAASSRPSTPSVSRTERPVPSSTG